MEGKQGDVQARAGFRRVEGAGIRQSRGRCIALVRVLSGRGIAGRGGVLCAGAGFGGVAGYSVYAEEGADEAGDGGPDLGCVSGEYELFVFFPDRVAEPVRVLHPPVPADVGEQVFRGGLVRGEAGDVEDGLCLPSACPLAATAGVRRYSGRLPVSRAFAACTAQHAQACSASVATGAIRDWRSRGTCSAHRMKRVPRAQGRRARTRPLAGLRRTGLACPG